MAEYVDVGIGPSTVRVAASERFAGRLEDHVDGFTSPGPSAAVDVEVRLDLGGKQGSPVAHRSREVAVNVTKGRGLEIDANLVMTPRAALRRVKRLAQPAHWQNGRWRLLLRNSFELSSLANLEYVHGYVAIHAAAVIGRGGCVLLLGGNGAGKSTLACHLIDTMGLRLLSDNFTPCNGEYAIGFPGSPRAKPGLTLPSLRTVAGEGQVRGVVALDTRLVESSLERGRQFEYHLGFPYESHRGTGFEALFGGGPARGRMNDHKIASLLTSLPFMSYDFRYSERRSVEEFIGAECGISSI